MSFLHIGDTVGIVAPSSGQKEEDLTPALAYFESLGLKVKIASNVKKKYRYMAGSDIERAQSINKMFADPEIKALFCIRGGAGSTRILDLLDYNTIKNNPKPLIGLSDSTAIQNALITKTNNPSLTGFLPLYDFKNKNIDNLVDNSLKNALFSDTHQLTSGTCFSSGNAKGCIIGGCLSVLCYLCGTQYFPDLAGKILLLEDIGERTYKLDLMLNQLKQQKNFNKLQAVIIGQFANCPVSDADDGDISSCIKDFAKDLTIPVITDFAYGHIPSRHILPLGIPVTLKATKNNCTISW